LLTRPLCRDHVLTRRKEAHNFKDPAGVAAPRELSSDAQAWRAGSQRFPIRETLRKSRSSLNISQIAIVRLRAVRPRMANAT